MVSWRHKSLKNCVSFWSIYFNKSNVPATMSKSFPTQFLISFFLYLSLLPPPSFGPLPRAHTVERAKKHLSRLCKTITIRKMAQSTIREIIFKKLAAVIKSSEVVKKLSLKQQSLSPSPIPVPCPPPYNYISNHCKS